MLSRPPLLSHRRFSCSSKQVCVRTFGWFAAFLKPPSGPALLHAQFLVWCARWLRCGWLLHSRCVWGGGRLLLPRRPSTRDISGDSLNPKVSPSHLDHHRHLGIFVKVNWEHRQSHLEVIVKSFGASSLWPLSGLHQRFLGFG